MTTFANLVTINSDDDTLDTFVIPSCEPPAPSSSSAFLSQPGSAKLIWLILTLVSIMTIGGSWIYDTPGAVYTSLASRFGSDYTTAQNQVLYSVYSWPNVLLAMLAGAMIDQWLGLNKSTILVAALVVVGQLLFSVAISEVVYWLAVLGRFIYGLGGESLKVAQNTWIARYAPERNLSLVFGAVLGVSRASGAINFALTPTIATNSVLWAIWLGTILTIVSFIASIAVVRLAPSCDTRHVFADQLSGGTSINTDILQATANESIPSSLLSAETTSGSVQPEDRHQTSHPTISPPNLVSASGWRNFAKNAETVWKQLLQLKQILLSFPIEVYLQFLICVFYHVGVLLLYQIASEFLQYSGPRHTERTASLLVAIPAFIAIVGTPLAGYMVDQYGKALWSIFGSCLLLLLSHILLIVFVIRSSTDSNIYDSGEISVCIIAFVIVGISYSVATASIWPLVPFMLPEDQLAIGYGAMSSVENLGLAVLPLVLTAVQNSPNISHLDNPWRYITPLIILLAMAMIAALITVIHIYMDNTHHNGRMNLRAAQRKRGPRPTS